MKKNNSRSIFTIFLSICLVSSCTISDKVTTSKIVQKRKYNRGYFVDATAGKIKTEDSGHSKKPGASQQQDMPFTWYSEQDDNTGKTLSHDNLIASADESRFSPVAGFKPENNLYKIPSVKDTIIPVCDLVTMRNGDEIEVKIMEVNPYDIKYKKCNNLEGPSYTVNKSDVFMIKYSNGTKDVFRETESYYEENVTVSSNNSLPKNRKTDSLAVLGFISGIIGIFFFTILFGLTALILSATSLVNISNNRDTKKGTGLAVAGLIIGIVDIILWIIIISLLL